MKMTLAERRVRIHRRIRKKLAGTATRPRLTVYRSNKSIYCQVIDDNIGHTLAAATSIEIATKGTKVEQAKAVGAAIAEKTKAAGITAVVFDRGGLLYHGRIKALAEGAREGGLEF